MHRPAVKAEGVREGGGAGTGAGSRSAVVPLVVKSV